MNRNLLKWFTLLVILFLLGVNVVPSINAGIKEQGQKDGKSTHVQKDNDCGCYEGKQWNFPVICKFLDILFEIVLMFSPFPVPLSCWIIILIAEELNCPDIP